MSEFVRAMTLGELKEIIQKLENEAVPEETKIMLDTGWDSLQEILPGAVQVKEARAFKVQDELTKEYFGGYALVEKAEKMAAEGAVEKVVVIENLY
ncbi:hypothetical protein [Enterococcus olivae]